MRRVGSAVVIGVVVACASCSGPTADRSVDATAGGSSAVASAMTTAMPAPSTSADGRACARTPIERAGLPEVQGIGRDATIYGLLFLTHAGPVRAGEQLKVVWRMTGQGDLSVSYFAPDGRPGVLTFGPEVHSGSTYQRPGDEWGTGFSFDVAGCWHVHLERSVGSGDVWLDVAP